MSKSLGSKPKKKEVEKALLDIEDKYQSDDFSFALARISEGYQFLTKAAYHKTVSSYLNVKSKRRLSTAAMETLAIISYKQPVTKSEMEQIRGVNCDYSVQRLLEKELVEIQGRSPGPGRPLLYGTSKMFMDHFGLESLKDLPQMKEVVPQENSIGEAEPDAEAAVGEVEGENASESNPDAVANTEEGNPGEIILEESNSEEGNNEAVSDEHDENVVDEETPTEPTDEQTEVAIEDTEEFNQESAEIVAESTAVEEAEPELATEPVVAEESTTE